MALTATPHPLSLLSLVHKRNRADFEEEDNLDIGGTTCDSIDTHDKYELPPQGPLTRAELTSSNLLAHTQSFDPSAGIIMAAPSTPSKVSQSTADSAEALAEYGLQVEPRVPYPLDLENHLNRFIRVKRSLPPSPAAAELSQKAHILKYSNEGTIVNLISGAMTFKGKYDDPVDGEHHIRLDVNISFKKSLVCNRFRQLTQPQPDLCVGYILERDAAPRTTALFASEEEKVLLDFGPSTLRLTIFPVVTAQVKTSKADYEKASAQTARDIMALDAAMRNLVAASGLTVTAVDTLHWSLTCNGQVMILFIHWSVRHADGRITYYMKEFFKTFLSGSTEALPQMRAYMRNILDFALNQRVQRLKAIVHRIRNPDADSGYNGSARTVPTPQLESDRQAKGTSSIFLHQSAPVTPQTPSRHVPMMTPTRRSNRINSTKRSPEATPTKRPKKRHADTTKDDVTYG